MSEKCKEDYTCEFRIIYANSFLKNNLFKQLTFNNLKLISILCVYVCIVSLVIVKAYEYIEEISVEQLRNDVVSDAYNISNEEDDEYDLEDEDEDHEGDGEVHFDVGHDLHGLAQARERCQREQSGDGGDDDDQEARQLQNPVNRLVAFI